MDEELEMTESRLIVFRRFRSRWSFGSVNSPRRSKAKNPVVNKERKRASSMWGESQSCEAIWFNWEKVIGCFRETGLFFMRLTPFIMFLRKTLSRTILASGK